MKENTKRLTRNEAPIDCDHIRIAEELQMWLKGGISRARHVLGADRGTALAIGQEVVDGSLGVRGVVVDVEGNHIRAVHLVLLEGRVVCGGGVCPDRGGDRLEGISRPHPVRDFHQQRADLLVGVARVVGLVPEVPSDHAVVVFKVTHDAAHILLELVELDWIVDNIVTGGLHPLRVMHTRDGRRLRTQSGIGQPAGVKQDKHHANVMLVGDIQKCLEALEKSLGILSPQKVVEKNTDNTHAQVGSIAKFTVDGFQIKGICLEHFQFIDSGAGRKVGACLPSHFLLPCTSRFNGPTFGEGTNASRGQKEQSKDNADEHLECVDVKPLSSKIFGEG